MGGTHGAPDDSRVRLGLLLVLLIGATTLAALLGATTQASAGGVCVTGARDGYSYAGHQATHRGHGVRATLSMDREPSVRIGHVAGWIGVGGQSQGADGQDAWIQVGIASTPGNGVAVYAEILRSGRQPRLVLVREGVEVGHPYELAVLEIAGRPGWWRVWVDGNPVTASIRMSGSSGRWAPLATAESWNAGTTACNAFGFRFEDVSVSYGAGGSWRTFVPGHRFLDEGTTLGEVTPSIVHSRAYARRPVDDALAYSFVASSS
jgi:hypothetical protein